MWKNEKMVFNKKPDFEKLKEYGFTEKSAGHQFAVDIMDGMFRLNIDIGGDGIPRLELMDQETNSEYTLAGNACAAGSFVGQVRTACDVVLEDIVRKCYEPNVFKNESTKLVIRYIREKYATEEEYLWEKTPNNAIFRETKTRKWFAVLMTVEKKKIGIWEDGMIEIMNLKNIPEKVEELVDGKTCFAGYHMNKKHWYTILLDGSVPQEKIYTCIDESYHLVSPYCLYEELEIIN